MARDAVSGAHQILAFAHIASGGERRFATRLQHEDQREREHHDDRDDGNESIHTPPHSIGSLRDPGGKALELSTG